MGMTDERPVTMTKQGEVHQLRGHGSRRALLIGQHPYLFSGTVGDNITLGQPGASRFRGREAIEAAQLTGLLARLPDGLDTVLGERGWSISGGEAQRAALARALLSGSPRAGSSR
jgi:ABC-type multidrug transport system fused ATPase/permease subunit